MKNASEVQGFQDMVQRASKSSWFRIIMSEHASWKSTGVTLQELKRHKDNNEQFELFTAIIDKKLYVADENMITEWQDDLSGKLEFVQVIDWQELNNFSHHFSNYHTFIACLLLPSRQVELFHNKISLLIALHGEMCMTSSTAGYYLDDSGWVCCPNVKDFEALQKSIVRDFNRIMEFIPTGYEKSRQYLDYKSREEAPSSLLLPTPRHQVENMPAVKHKSHVDDDLEFFKALK